MVKDKQEHLSNTSWITNQDWDKFKHELEGIKTKLMRVEASLANELQDVKDLRQSIEENNHD